ncbi:hypothetical protein [Hymenobacter sp. CRA2]|uniref:hypothetical protein n=1 Tax=Hymenobacter sp. CRA2 TaxID=1955620 RepID=UPI00098EC840|nr:hypothetical protein [Hymenobacter sp. CRA2]OON70791.1 hypothetical protein B0919_01915 [Hymenobacter sp. CRA2]
MEDYAAKMAGKTDAELQLYVDRRAEYREEAVLAALTELERRGHAVPDASMLRESLQVAALQAAAQAPPAPPTWARPAEAAAVEEEPTGPELYSPGTIAIFSIVFSCMVGGVLLLLNFLRLRRYGGAALLMALVIGMFGAQIWLPTYLAKLSVDPRAALIGFNLLMALLYVYVLWPLFIGAQSYQPRSWLTPLLVMLGLSFFGLMLLRTVMGAMPPMP